MLQYITIMKNKDIIIYVGIGVIVGVIIGLLIDSRTNELQRDDIYGHHCEMVLRELYRCKGDLKSCRADPIEDMIVPLSVDEPSCPELLFIEFNFTDTELRDISAMIGITAKGESIEDYFNNNVISENTLDAYIFYIECTFDVVECTGIEGGLACTRDQNAQVIELGS